MDSHAPRGNGPKMFGNLCRSIFNNLYSFIFNDSYSFVFNDLYSSSSWLLHSLELLRDWNLVSPRHGALEARYAESSITAIRAQATPPHCSGVTDSCSIHGTRAITTTG